MPVDLKTKISKALAIIGHALSDGDLEKVAAKLNTRNSYAFRLTTAHNKKIIITLTKTMSGDITASAVPEPENDGGGNGGGNGGGSASSGPQPEPDAKPEPEPTPPVELDNHPEEQPETPPEPEPAAPRKTPRPK